MNTPGQRTVSIWEGHSCSATTHGVPEVRNLAASWAKVQSKNEWRKRTYTWGLDLSGSIQGLGGVGGLLAMNGWYLADNAWGGSDSAPNAKLAQGHCGSSLEKINSSQSAT